MAILYFTTNADSGDGSLRATINAASAGDEIRPDPSVFTRGATITISLASTINVQKSLTFNGVGNRVRLDANENSMCVNAATAGTSVTFIDFDFVRGRSNYEGGGVRVWGITSATFKRCKFLGCYSASNGAGLRCYNANLTLENCLVAGNYATGAYGGVYANGTSLNVASSTICANLAPSSNPNVNAAVNVVNSITATDWTTPGFVAPPPSTYDATTWTADAWEDWDFRLLDDGASSPSAQRDAGTLTDLPTYDLDGNFRGRVSSGVASCSPGAYETLQADLFWVGKDSSGQDVASPSFASADGWAASRFATVGGSTAPTSTSKLFVDGDLTLGGNISGTTAAAPCGLIVGGSSTVAAPDLSAVYADTTLGVGATFGGASESTVLIATTAKVGDFVRVNKPIDFLGTTEIGTDVYVRSANNSYGGSLPSAPEYGTITVYRKTADDVILSGTYDVGTFTAQRNVVSSSVKIPTAVGTTLNVETSFTTGGGSESSLGEWFTNPVRVVLGPDAIATDSSNPSGATSILADDFTVELTGNATLTLRGQKVSGSGGTVSLTGSADVSGTLTATTLTQNAGSTLNVLATGSLTATNATLNSGSALNGAVGSTVAITRLTLLSSTLNVDDFSISSLAIPSGSSVVTAGDLTATNTLTAEGTANVGGTLTASAVDVTGGSVTANAASVATLTSYSGCPVSITGDLTATGAVETSGNLTVGGDLTAASWTTGGTATITGDVELSGAATINGATTINGAFESASATVASGATATFNGAATVSGTTAISGTTNANGAFSSATTTLTGGTLNANGGATLGTASLDATSTLSVAAAKTATATSATLASGSTLSGSGYFASDSLTDNGATYAATLRRCSGDASVTAFTGTANGPATATLNWTKTNASGTVVLERQSGDSWTLDENNFSASTKGEQLNNASATFRLWDGSEFRTITVEPAAAVQLTSVTESTQSPTFRTSITATVAPTSATVSYQWYRVDAEDVETAITGATSSSYTPLFDDLGSKLRIKATGTGDYGGTVSATTTNETVLGSSVSIYDGETLTISGSTSVDSLSVADGGTVVVSDGAILTTTTTTLADGATINGSGYFYAATLTDSGATYASTLRYCSGNAGITSVSVASSPNTATVTATKTNSTGTYVVEKITGDAAQLIQSNVLTSVTVTANGETTFRTWDGSSFKTATVTIKTAGFELSETFFVGYCN